jgi:hypothetical protein
VAKKKKRTLPPALRKYLFKKKGASGAKKK